MSIQALYEVPVSTAANVTTFVVVAAGSVEEASDKALLHVRTHGGVFVLDDDSIHWNDAYLPDPYGGTELVQSPVEQRSIDEAPRGVLIVVADAHDTDQAVFLNGRLIQTADAAQGDSIDDLLSMANNLANALGTDIQTVHLMQEADDWSWDDVTRQLFKDAPGSEQQLCNEFVRFCSSENLPHQSADELLCLDLTETQKAWLIRFVIRWESVVGS
jgi:hypothetical protein